MKHIPRVATYVTDLHEILWESGSPSVSIGTLGAALWRGSRACLRPVGVDRGPGAPFGVDRGPGGGAHPAGIAGPEAALRGGSRTWMQPSNVNCGRGGGSFMWIAGLEAALFSWIAASGTALVCGSLARRQLCVVGGKPGSGPVAWIAGRGLHFWCGLRAWKRPFGVDRGPGGGRSAWIAGLGAGPWCASQGRKADLLCGSCDWKQHLGMGRWDRRRPLRC